MGVRTKEDTTLDKRIEETKVVDKLVKVLNVLDSVKVPYFINNYGVVVIDRVGYGHLVYSKPQ